MTDHRNLILAALSKRLDALFPDIPIFTEEVPQKLPDRCFLIGFAGETQTDKDLGNRYRVYGSLEVTYLAPLKGSETQIRQEMNTVAAKIALELGVIQHKKITLRLQKHVCRVDKNELHDVCDFSTFLFRVDRTPPIQDVKIREKTVKVKGGSYT